MKLCSIHVQTRSTLVDHPMLIVAFLNCKHRHGYCLQHLDINWIVQTVQCRTAPPVALPSLTANPFRWTRRSVALPRLLSLMLCRNKSVLYFTAKWCPPCRRIGPFFAELSSETPGVDFGKVDIDDNPDATSMAKVMTVPTFKFYKVGLTECCLGFLHLK